MPSVVSERLELAKLCSSKDWSKAIRLLDSILSHSCVLQDLCNRAFCYSRLELHKHVIKDCDKALQLDPKCLQAYLLKGHALSALGKKEDALLVWEQGYEHALCQSADLKQLVELEELLAIEKQNNKIGRKHEKESELPTLNVQSGSQSNGYINESFVNHCKFIDLPSKRGYASEISSKLIGNYDNCNEMREKFIGNGNSNFQCNGNSKFDGELRNEGNSSSADSVVTSEVTSKLSIVPSSSNSPENFSDSSKISDLSIDTSDEANRNRKISISKISKTKSINVDFRLSRGIAQVNEGKYAHAISIFGQILRDDPYHPEALIGRGTAHAFQRELDSAIGDFTKAIESNPCAGEAWKRRGQARAAMGESHEAIGDLNQALMLEPDSADVLHERGIVNFKFKDFLAAVEDLSKCVMLDKNNASAYTYLGLSLSSVGEFKKAEEAHLKAIQLDENFLEAWVNLTQFYQDLANPVKGLECIQQLLQIDSRYPKAYHLRGLLLHGMGEHRKAIKDLSSGLSIESANIECLYLRASCYHAIGDYGQAIKDYDATLDLELDSMEKFVIQCLAFYQKELALYTASKINSSFCWFDVDGDIDPLFKEYWCKRLHPKNVCEKVFRQPPLRESLKKGKLRRQDCVVTKQKTALLQAADSMGKKIQYDCPGFLPNKRQHRMAGLAAIEIAQKVSKVWRSLQTEWKYSNKALSKFGKRSKRRERLNMPSQNRGGGSCSISGFSETSSSYSSVDNRSSSCSSMSWQAVYSLAVKWRQISEPCDPVVWINKLSEEFNSGFGSHTPMILGQAKVVRYFPNFERTVEVAKTVIKDKSHVYNKADEIVDLSRDGKLQDFLHAKSCSDLYRLVGEDFWLATWCNSTAFKEKRLEGTRITLMKTGECGFDFAIRTPCTPSRWNEFDAEMTTAWETICYAYCGDNYGSTDFSQLESVRDAILRMSYYWYNFMPLSRGSAAVGFIVMLGLFLAANMEFTGNIPPGLQVDWEAILNLNPTSFVDSVKRWLYSSVKISTAWKDYPDLESTFETTGSVVAALSSFDA